MTAVRIPVSREPRGGRPSAGGRRDRHDRNARTWYYRCYGIGPAKRAGAHLVAMAFAAYILVPLFWIALASTKTNQNIVTSFGFWFAAPFHLWDNLTAVMDYQNGLFPRWILNSLLYAGSSGVLATVVAALAGFAFAKLEFRWRRPIMALIIGAVAIPSTALVVPLYLFISYSHLVNTPLAVILPSLGNAFGAFLTYIYVQASVPSALLDAARVDGASELRIFWRIGVPIMLPGCVTVLLFVVVGVWNNFFLPLLVFNDPRLYPVTVGLAQWNASIAGGSGQQILYSLLVTGSLLSMIPTVAAFLILQRYWRQGLALGSLAGE
ncbi:MAG TPA: carbohydrate ABC transporter permease [Streptosporangiaceae bacterium]|nr:carbohydrate ABC transporter permease [Streptosporangiaceae bacterium]